VRGRKERKERYRFPIDVEDDGGAWYVGDEGRGIDEQKFKNWFAVWKMCLMLLRKLAIEYPGLVFLRMVS
jgi:hypothetical protein